MSNTNGFNGSPNMRSRFVGKHVEHIDGSRCIHANLLEASTSLFATFLLIHLVLETLLEST